MTDGSGAGAEARDLAGWYRLAAELVAKEPDEELVSALASVPAFREHLQPEAVARHTDVFVLNVHPFASVYLEPDGALHGRRAAFTSDVLRALGLRVEAREGMAADHVSVVFDALAALLERQADAAVEVEAERAAHAQRTLLREHLLPWAPAMLGAVERADDGLYRALARSLRETLRRHVARLAGGEVQQPAQAAPATSPVGEPDGGPGDGSGDGSAERPAEDPSPPPSQDAEEPFAWLAAPSRCGTYFGRDDLARIASEAGLSARVGGRRFVLRELARATDGDRSAHRLREALAAFVERRRDELTSWCRDLPSDADVWNPWLERLEETSRRLRRETAPAEPEAPPAER